MRMTTAIEIPQESTTP